MRGLLRQLARTSADLGFAEKCVLMQGCSSNIRDENCMAKLRALTHKGGTIFLIATGEVPPSNFGPIAKLSTSRRLLEHQKDFRKRRVTIDGEDATMPCEKEAVEKVS